MPPRNGLIASEFMAMANDLIFRARPILGDAGILTEPADTAPFLEEQRVSTSVVCVQWGRIKLGGKTAGV